LYEVPANKAAFRRLVADANAGRAP
jgi:hypothetical protein